MVKKKITITLKFDVDIEIERETDPEELAVFKHKIWGDKQQFGGWYWIAKDANMCSSDLFETKTDAIDDAKEKLKDSFSKRLEN